MRAFMNLLEGFQTKDGRPIRVWHEENTEHTDIGYDPNWDVYAAVDGKVVGSGWFTDDHFSGVHVEEEFRRQGIATALYDYVEGLGCYVRPSPNGQEPDGEAFWAARKAGKTLEEAQHSEPSWQYDEGGQPFGFGTTAREVRGSFKIKDEKSFSGEWPYGYSFVFARNGEVEVSFYLDAANYFSRDLNAAVEAGRVSPEVAQELKYRQLGDGMGAYNMMGPNVARTVLRVMGQLIERFVAEYDPPVLMMVAKTERRKSIYERLLRGLPGYEISSKPDPRGNGHLIYARKDGHA